MSTFSKLLIVEDDKNQGFLLSSHLESAGFQIDLASDGEEGYNLFKKRNYDLCIFDIMMPRMDGLSLVKKIKNLNQSTPFIFLSARNLKSDKMTGYEMGCEDYITKPFDVDLLVHKINVILKRTTGKRQTKDLMLNAGKLELKAQERTIYFDQTPYVLTQKETTLLTLFFKNLNTVISRKKLMIETWGNDDFFTSKSMDVHLTRVRKILKLDSTLKLVNIHGYGYKLTDGNA